MLTRLYKYLRWLSLDVVVGAIVLCAFLCQELSVEYTWEELTCLGLAVLLIYNVDHLLDAQKIIGTASSRRQFHIKYRVFILATCFVALIMAVILLTRIDERIIAAGAVLAASSVLYLVMSKRMDWFKEFWVAGTFAFGVTLIALTRSTVFIETLLITTSIGTIAFVNLLLISLHEEEEDEEEGFRSLVTTAGSAAVKKILLVALILLFIAAAIIFHQNISLPIGIFVLISMTLYVLIWRVKWFETDERYRFIADLVFLLPVIWLF